MNTQIAFPDHNTDPRKKLEKPFMLQFAKAVWSNRRYVMPDGSCFYAKREKYSEIRDYRMARQSVEKYKKNLLSDETADSTYMKISWEPRADGMILGNIAVSKLQKAMYNIVATPINQKAKDAQDDEFNAARVKIMMREAAEEQDPELAQSPLLRRMPGESEDLEELEMQIQFSPRFIRAKDTEEAVSLVFYEEEAINTLDRVSEDLIDYGAGVVKEWLDEANKVRIGYVDPGDFIISYTKKPDFSDIIYAGEVMSVKLSDLSKYFSEEEIKDLRNKVQSKDGNPHSLGDNDLEHNGYDIFKAKVLDLEFISWDKRVMEEGINKYGNIRVSKTKPSYENRYAEGKRYTARTVENVYRCKWVVGTDLIYGCEKAKNQKRSVSISSMSKTKLSYHIAAANFHKMNTKGMTESMMSVIDDLNEATFKLRNLRNRLIPNGFDIDISALENVALGASGKKMEPKELLDLFFETGSLISRRTGIGQDQNVNYKAIMPISNTIADQLMQLSQDIQNSKQALREITGLNELTDGSTPNPKTLTTIANLANESTNNALYPYINARKKIIESLAKGVVQRLQAALLNGPYDGYNPNTGRFVNVAKSILDYDYDIMLEDKPTDEQRQSLMMLMQEDIKNGVLDTSDVITIINTYNVKHAQILLSYKAKKNREKQQQMAIQNTQATAQAQMQSNQEAERIKLIAKLAEHKMKLEQIDHEKSWEFVIQQEKNAGSADVVERKAITEVLKEAEPQAT